MGVGVYARPTYMTDYTIIASFSLQGDGRTYSHSVAISCENDPDWEDLAYFARVIPKVCRNINRVCYAFGGKR